jgi:hypothetical protein
MPRRELGFGSEAMRETGIENETISNLQRNSQKSEHFVQSASAFRRGMLGVENSPVSLENAL